MTSDKGLCGGINSGIVRELKSLIGNERSKYSIFAIGAKGEVALTRPFPDIFHSSISRVITPMNWPTASSIGY
jgi:F-type H+-transporting ATPase subunit gamma